MGQPDRPWIEGRVASADPEDRKRWFRQHAEVAAQEILDFLDDAGWAMSGRRVLDLGCGDGFIDLGLARQGNPMRLIGTDLEPTDTDELEQLCEEVYGEPLPTTLEFRQCEVDSIPLPDRSMDLVVSWSAFEHVDYPVQVLKEVRRVLRPRGAVFIQIWPLYWSEHGSHFWYWFPEGWEHLRRSVADVRSEVAESTDLSGDVVDAMLVDFDSLNRLTVGELQRAILAAGLRITRVELMTGTIEVPPGLEHLPVLDLLSAGIKLLAVRA